MPHLHATHWRISSVVPAKLPSARGYRPLADVPCVRLATRLSARTSGVDRTRAAHCAPDGSAAPTGNVTKRPPGGTGGVVDGGVMRSATCRSLTAAAVSTLPGAIAATAETDTATAATIATNTAGNLVVDTLIAIRLQL